MLPENRAPCLVPFTPWTSRVKAKSVSWRGLWGWKGDLQQRLRDDEMMRFDVKNQESMKKLIKTDGNGATFELFWSQQ